MSLLRAIKPKPDQVHALQNFRVAHEPAPDQSTAQILCTQKHNANINADDVGIYPTIIGIESVGESVSAINFLAELLFHRSQSLKRNIRREHQRAAGGSRDYCPINCRVARRPTPCHVTFNAVGGGDAPHVRAIAAKLCRQLDAEGSMRARSADRIKKVIRAPAPLLAAPAIVDPRMRVLMHEERNAFSRDIAVTSVIHAFALEGIP